VLVLVCLALGAWWFGSSLVPGNADASLVKATGSKKGWCQAKPNSAWKQVLRGRVVHLSHRVSIGPLALANEGRSFYAEIYGKSYSGVVRIDARSNRYTKIKRFSDPVNYQASGDFDGRWLVWAEYHSLYDNLSDFTVWSWDSLTGRIRQIGRANRSSSGEFWPSSWNAPVAHQGYAAWQEGACPDELREIHVVDLANGHDRIIRRGHPSGPFLIDGPRVIWPESMKRGALTVMRAADARTGRLVATTPALRKLRGAIWPASNGKSLLYATDDQTSLWWSPSFSATPRRVYKGRKYSLLGIPLNEVRGRYTSFSIPLETYVADTVAGRYVRIYPGGWAIVGSKALVLLTPSKRKANHAITDIFYVPLKSLPPVPSCG